LAYPEAEYGNQGVLELSDSVRLTAQ